MKSKEQLENYGLDISNPIQVSSIGEGYNYLDRIITEQGEKISHHRTGSSSTSAIKVKMMEVETDAMVDIYSINDSSGKEIATFYICPYFNRNSTVAPKGFKFTTAASIKAEREKTPSNPVTDSYVDRLKSMSKDEMREMSKKQGLPTLSDSELEDFVKFVEANPNPRANQPKKENEGCFIATATLGNYDHPVVIQLRSFRDNWILKKSWGEAFVRNYYFYGHILSKSISSSIILRKLSYYFIIKPLYLISKILLRKYD
jgi:hypothetical protein